MDYKTVNRSDCLTSPLLRSERGTVLLLLRSERRGLEANIHPLALLRSERALTVLSVDSPGVQRGG